MTSDVSLTRFSKLGRLLWQTSKYAAFFIAVYVAINWWRKPIMPINPQLQLTSYQGQTVDLEALSYESPVLVYFWGSWCGVCKLTSPTIQTLSEAASYPVVSIAIQSGNNPELGAYMADKGFTFTTVNDQTGTLFADWQGQVTPSYVVLKDGVMTQGLTGIQPLWSLRLRLWLASLG